MDFSFTNAHSLETLTEYTQEYGSELAREDATIVDEILTARIHIENANESTTLLTQQEELNTALEQVEFAQQLDSLESEHKTELEELHNAINRVKATLDT